MTGDAGVAAGVRATLGVAARELVPAFCEPAVPDDCCLTQARQPAWLLKLNAVVGLNEALASEMVVE